MKNSSSRGLAGVIVGETAISTVGQANVGLTYRGYSIHDLAISSSFEEVAYLLIYGELPSEAELCSYLQLLRDLRSLPVTLKTVLELLPKDAHPMDILRTGCSCLGILEPGGGEHDKYYLANRLIACFPGILMYWYHFHTHGQQIEMTTNEESIAGHFLHMFCGRKPDEVQRRALEVSLILYAEHEFNPSSFISRIAASVGTDFYSSITAAIGALKGPLHGGALAFVMELIRRFQTPDEVEAGVREMLANKKSIAGFGHRIYLSSDPRSDIIKFWSQRLSESHCDVLLYQIAERLELIMQQKYLLSPNVDFYSALVYHFCDIHISLFASILAISRITGWSAHVIEQSRNNRIIRPSASYTGAAPRKYVPLTERT